MTVNWSRMPHCLGKNANAEGQWGKWASEETTNLHTHPLVFGALAKQGHVSTVDKCRRLEEAG